MHLLSSYSENCKKNLFILFLLFVLTVHNIFYQFDSFHESIVFLKVYWTIDFLTIPSVISFTTYLDLDLF